MRFFSLYKCSIILCFIINSPWLETCIGQWNHKYFWLFLLFTNITILWSSVITWRAFDHRSSRSEWITANLLYLFNLQVLIISFLVTFTLWSIHSYFMLTNTTTWEKAARKRITYLKSLKNDSFNPFHEGYCRNIFLSFCYWKDIKWENFYKGVLNEDDDVQNGRIHNNNNNNNNESSSDEDDDVFVTTMISKHQQQKDIFALNKPKQSKNSRNNIVEIIETET